MASILVLVASGPEAPERTREGLQLALAMHHSGMLEGLAVLLTGAGVACLAAQGRGEVAAELREAVDALLEAGVEVAACTRALHARRLLDDEEALEGVRPVGAPTYLADKAGQGWQVLTF